MADSNFRKALVNAGNALAVLDYVRSRGHDPERLYRPAWSKKLQFSPDGDLVSVGDLVELIQIATAALRDPDFALKAGASVMIRHFGLVGRAAASCATGGDVIESAIRNAPLFGEVGCARLETRRDEAHLYWTWPYDCPPPPALPQFTLARRAMLLRLLTNRTNLKTDAYFHFPEPADTGEYVRVFGGRLRFAQAEIKLVFDAALLRAPIISADDELRRQAELGVDALRRRFFGEATMREQLEAVLAQNLAAGRSSLADAAAALKLSPRTLQRRLDEEGLSFRRMLDGVRKARAQEYLRDLRVSLAEVALHLGYSEQSAFQSAFKRWTGCTPGEFRSTFER